MQIIITAGKESMSIVPDEDISEFEFLNLLLQAYLNIASETVRNHDCDDPECHLQLLSTHIVSAINKTLDAHNFKFHH